MGFRPRYGRVSPYLGTRGGQGRISTLPVGLAGLDGTWTQGCDGSLSDSRLCLA